MHWFWRLSGRYRAPFRSRVTERDIRFGSHGDGQTSQSCRSTGVNFGRNFGAAPKNSRWGKMSLNASFGQPCRSAATCRSNASSRFTPLSSLPPLHEEHGLFRESIVFIDASHSHVQKYSPFNLVSRRSHGSFPGRAICSSNTTVHASKFQWTISTFCKRPYTYGAR